MSKQAKAWAIYIGDTRCTYSDTPEDAETQKRNMPDGARVVPLVERLPEEIALLAAWVSLSDKARTEVLDALLEVSLRRVHDSAMDTVAVRLMESSLRRMKALRGSDEPAIN